jgi:tRNA pseudouridine38-40 synthase
MPDDISVISAKAVDSDFHPRYDVKYKEYVYKIWNRQERNPFLCDRTLHYPKAIDNETIERMNRAAANFVGTHDFAAYMATDTKIQDTVRTIYEARVCRNGDVVEFYVSANGFLYNMVRILTGTLLAVAEGKISPDDIEEITNSKDRRKAGITVPAHGLYLNKVVY